MALSTPPRKVASVIRECGPDKMNGPSACCFHFRCPSCRCTIGFAVDDFTELLDPIAIAALPPLIARHNLSL